MAATPFFRDMGESEEATRSEPSDAFGRLGNEVRMSILGALLSAGDGTGTATLAFSELFERSAAENTAGFSYHLRQLTGHYLRKTDEGYALTYAGLKIARAIVAGTYTDSVDLDPVDLDDPCPFCDEAALAAAGRDNYLSIECGSCERPVLTLPFLPGGFRAHADDLPEAFDRQHRHRLSLMADGHCPECGGVVAAGMGEPSAAVAERLPGGDERVQLRLDCEGCGYRLRCPPTLAVLDHPAVVSFYHDHGADIRERPVWNVGPEWRESLVSAEPWCLCVSTRLDDDVLALYLDAEGSVVDVHHTTAAA